MKNILIAEDEDDIASFVDKGLRAAGYITTVAVNGEIALALARTGAFDLMVLDLGLPRLDGLSVLRRLREERITLPVIVLTARSTVSDTVEGLESGANDYMPKPFEVAELLARISLRLRDSDQQVGVPLPLEAAGLHLDLSSRQVRLRDGSRVDLTARETSVLEVLMLNANQLISRSQLLDHVWGTPHDPASNVVEVFIRSLRLKLGDGLIDTVRGLGYRLQDKDG